MFRTPQSQQLDVNESDYPEYRSSDARSAGIEFIEFLTVILWPTTAMTIGKAAEITVACETFMDGQHSHLDALLKIVYRHGAAAEAQALVREYRSRRLPEQLKRHAWFDVSEEIAHPEIAVRRGGMFGRNM